MRAGAGRWVGVTVAFVGILVGWLAPLALAAESSTSAVLPAPEPKFKGVIGRTWKTSKAEKLQPTKAPAGAPNVLLILIDDSGFGQWSTFGGQIPTPNLDRLAQNGLRYTRFHTTALCSPTRSALLTGRNHQSCGMGVITELANGFPGYTSVIPPSCGQFPEVLRQNGYSTAYFGKDHQIPDWETSAAGPFDRWPNRQGFDHFYGFVGGEANQWQPALYEDTHPVEMEVPKGREGHYTLNDALADKATDYIRLQKSVTPDRPFFVYFAPGATHAPHHVPPEWIEKFRGQFDQGWDAYREQTFERQKKLGVIPADAQLTPRPAEIPAYDSLTQDQMRVATRLMETFAAFTAQTDYEVGRLLDTLKETGQLDNTLVIWEIGDNGASMEGGLHGVFNEMTVLNGVQEDPANVLQHLDEVGGPKSYNHYPVGWAWAMNTPFQWGKQVASHFGGTRNPVVISWPRRIKDVGGIRTQFQHVIDLAPTILEAAGIRQPTELNGAVQKPIEGTSFVDTFTNAQAQGKRPTQYFEMFGNRAIYHDGWVAAARSGRLPWAPGGGNLDHPTWELYNIDADFSESHDVASTQPARLKSLQDLFWKEAAKYQVLPLDDRAAERLDPGMRPSLIAGRTDFTYFPGAVRIPENSAPNMKDKSFTITAALEVPLEGATGVLVAEGGVVGGFTLYLDDGVPHFEYNYFNESRYRVDGREKLAPGPATVRLDFKYDGGGLGKGGVAALFVNDRKVGEGRIEKSEAGRFSADETFDVGQDTGSPVSSQYQSPFPFTGTLRTVRIKLAPSPLTSNETDELDKLKQETQHATE